MIETKKLTHLALLITFALVLFVVEAQIPLPVPIPGLKLGLANIITLVAFYLYGPRDALIVLLLRILLGSFFAAQMMTFFFSLAGGLFCYLLTALLYRCFTLQKLWLLSALGACAHSLGQILVAIFVSGTTDIVWYLPFLLIGSTITGIFTGLTARYFINHLKIIEKK